MGLWSPVDVGRLKLPHTPEFKVAWKEGRKELFYPYGKMSFPSNRGGFLYVAGWPGVILA